MRQPLWSSGRNAESGQAKEDHHIRRGALTARSSRQRWCHITAGLNLTVFSKPKLKWQMCLWRVIDTFWYGNILESETFLYTGLEYFYTATFSLSGEWSAHSFFFFFFAKSSNLPCSVSSTVISYSVHDHVTSFLVLNEFIKWISTQVNITFTNYTSDVLFWLYWL